MAGTGDTPRAHQLGAEIRDLRLVAGIGFRELARQLGYTHTKLSHIESGRRAPTPEDTATILAHLGVTDDKREELLALARAAADPDWVAPGVGKTLAALLEYERTAKLITEANQALIPGLLQTRDYARSIMLSSGATTGEADHRVAIRMSRRDVLDRADPVTLRALVGEYALRYPACDASVMSDQMRHLLKWGERENVEIRVIPIASQWTPVHNGPFVLIEFERPNPVVHLENYRSAVFVTDKRDVRDYQNAAENLRRAAMNPAATTGLITELLNRWEEQ
ncbi:MAG TPA: helix-turn-helix transcriptional regulator [Pseudonocardiaceae bacterium]|jgi:transcriptional regulator with XRE-family HTH domain|nr:helix-turn-helix transcriptional regulator [Pseudonocardiaceae bacterium]